MTTAALAAERPARTVRRGQSQPLAGLRHQLRFTARRDRVRAIVWIVGIVGIVVVSAVSVLALYVTPADLESYGLVAQADAAFKAIAGPGYGLDEPTEGAVVMNETSLYTHVAVALMAVFMIVRHTRAEEDSGSAELVRAAPVGRYALLAAASVWVSGLCLVIGVGLAVALVGSGLPVSGSAAFGASIAATGVTFTGVSAVAAQLASRARAANSLGGIVLGVAFLVRAIGDIGTPWLTWVSPLGVAQAIRPFADERWWVLVPLAATAAGSFAAAFALLARRDLGAGFIGERPGPAVGSERLASPLALAARLQRSSIIGWIVGIAVTGLSFGVVIDQAEAFADNAAIADLIDQSGGGSVADQFVALTMLVLALMTSAFATASVLRLHSEETVGRVEPILATPVGRVRWWSSHLVVAFVAGLVIIVVAGLAVGLGSAGSTGEFDGVAPALGAALTLFAAVALVAAIAALVVAVVPRWAALSWGVVALATVVGLLADTLDLPQWIRDLSPFEHVPAVPAERFTLLPSAVLTALTVTTLAAGAFAVSRRDIAA